jgi:hypothetical protein
MDYRWIIDGLSYEEERKKNGLSCKEESPLWERKIGSSDITSDATVGSEYKRRVK